MTAQIKVSDSIEVGQSGLKQPFSWLIAILIFVAGVGLGIFATHLSGMETTPEAQPLTIRDNQGYSRGPSLTEYTTAILKNVADRQPALAAEAARYQDFAAFYAERAALAWPPRPNLAYLTEKVIRTDRSIAAEIARYNSLGIFYAAGNEVALQRAITADAARYSGLAGFYTTENNTSLVDFLAANPELITTYRDPKLQKMAQLKFLATNPELMVAHRYAVIVDWNHRYHPGR